MTALKLNPISTAFEKSTDPIQLRALIAYDDFRDGLRAKQCLDRVLDGIGADMNLELSCWRLDLLNRREIRKEAVKEAAECDVVILSLHGRRTIPSSAKKWLREAFEQRGGRDCALAVLLDSEQKRAAAAKEVLASLRSMTERQPVEVFPGFIHVAGNEADLTVDEMRHRADSSSNVLEGILQKPDSPRPVAP